MTVSSEASKLSAAEDSNDEDDAFAGITVEALCSSSFNLGSDKYKEGIAPSLKVLLSWDK